VSLFGGTAANGISLYSHLARGSDEAQSYQDTSLPCGGGVSCAGVVDNIIAVIDAIIPILVMVALIIFFVGLIQYISQSGDAHAHGKSKGLILWGLVALFVLMSLWGILEIALSVFPTSG